MELGRCAAGLVFAAPAVPIAAVANVSLGVVFALGMLPVAMLGLPPTRPARLKLFAVGILFAGFYAAGCVVGKVSLLAIAAMFVVAGGSALVAASHHKAAALLPALATPAFALGMNHPAPDGFKLAAMFLAGAAWTTLVDVLWPLPDPADLAQRPQQPPPRSHDPSRRTVRTYALLFAAAAAIGIAVAYALDLSHPAWAGAAAVFIMRPDPNLVTSRAIGRVCATIAGVLLAALLYQHGIGEAAIIVIAVCTVAAMVATRSSHWYVTAAGSGLVVLLISGVSSTEAFEHAFSDRIFETLLGAALALLLGVLGPRLLRAHDRDAGLAQGLATKRVGGRG